MKTTAILLIAVTVPAMALAMPPAMLAQSLPDGPNPQPSAASLHADPVWVRVQALARGEKIKVHLPDGSRERCRFGGATDAQLYCDPPDDSRRMDGYAIRRADVRGVSIDHDERNARLVLGAFVLTGGIWLAAKSAQTGNSSDAFVGGLIGAGLGGLVGMPATCLTGHCIFLPRPPMPMYGVGVRVPLGPMAAGTSPIRRLWWR